MIRQAATAVLLAALSVSGLADAPSLLDYELRSLQAPERENLQLYAGQPLLMTFFQPECSWCLRQVRTINKLEQACPGEFRAIAVGVNGDRVALKKELRRLRPNFPAFEASPALLSDIGGVPATPFSLIGNKEGNFVGWLRGYIPAEKLAEQLALNHCAEAVPDK